MRTLSPLTDTPDWIVGFHAQQAIEKAMKAVLLAKNLDAPKIHDLEDLSRRVSDGGMTLPVHPDTIASFTPWAAAGRYPDLPSDESLDRAAADAIVQAVLAWATPLVEQNP